MDLTKITPSVWRLCRRAGSLAIAITLAGLWGPSVAIGQPAGHAVGSAEADLTFSRPDPEGVPTKLSIGFYLVDIESIDDPKQEFTADLYLIARWRDSRLARSENINDQSQRILPLSKVWQPDVGILNRRAIQTTLPQVARVDVQGNVEYAQRLRGQFAAPLDLHRFPFDRQRLEIQFISYRYAPDELEITVGRTLRYESFSVAGWRAGEPLGEVTPLEIPASGGRAGLTLRVEAERERAFYLLTLVLPLTLIALMAWLVFWIDPSLLPSQLAISTASVFTLIAFRLSLMWSLPKVSYLTLADTFVLAVTLLVFGALGQTVITGRLAKVGKEELAKKLDVWGRWIYAAVLLVILLVVLSAA
jgi:hypothetical protein